MNAIDISKSYSVGYLEIWKHFFHFFSTKFIFCKLSVTCSMPSHVFQFSYMLTSCECFVLHCPSTTGNISLDWIHNCFISCIILSYCVSVNGKCWSIAYQNYYSMKYALHDQQLIGFLSHITEMIQYLAESVWRDNMSLLYCIFISFMEIMDM